MLITLDLILLLCCGLGSLAMFLLICLFFRDIVYKEVKAINNNIDRRFLYERHGLPRE